MTVVATVFAVLLGLAIGSFLTVVLWRVPRGESVVRPRSYCPECGTPIKERHNVPVFGWLVLRGRCAACKNPISPRYPLIEASTGAAYGVTAALVGVSWWLLPALLGATALMTAVAWWFTARR
jgi:leader peptidase (prepilin peptidase)/N-methyltransferase